MELRAVRGDITEADVDVVVNAANPGLLGGGGVDGAIHRAAGPTVLAECRAIVAQLPARWIVHTAGPIWSESSDRSAVLRSCYRESLRVADELGARSVAFPAISAGVYGWPIEDAARRAVAGVREAALEHVAEVRFVLFSDEALAAFERAISG